MSKKYGYFLSLNYNGGIFYWINISSLNKTIGVFMLKT